MLRKCLNVVFGEFYDDVKLHYLDEYYLPFLLLFDHHEANHSWAIVPPPSAPRGFLLALCQSHIRSVSGPQLATISLPISLIYQLGSSQSPPCDSDHCRTKARPHQHPRRRKALVENILVRGIFAHVGTLSAVIML